MTTSVYPESSEIPQDDAVISAARALMKGALSWKLGKVYQHGIVQTTHAVLLDGCSWHARTSRHSLPFDRFWAVLGHQWMPAKKAFNDEYVADETSNLSLLTDPAFASGTSTRLRSPW